MAGSMLPNGEHLAFFVASKATNKNMGGDEYYGQVPSIPSSI
jgi:hypothetical protein